MKDNTYKVEVNRTGTGIKLIEVGSDRVLSTHISTIHFHTTEHATFVTFKDVAGRTPDCIRKIVDPASTKKNWETGVDTGRQVC